MRGSLVVFMCPAYFTKSRKHGRLDPSDSDTNIEPATFTRVHVRLQRCFSRQSAPAPSWPDLSRGGPDVEVAAAPPRLLVCRTFSVVSPGWDASQVLPDAQCSLASLSSGARQIAQQSTVFLTSCSLASLLQPSKCASTKLASSVPAWTQC